MPTPAEIRIARMEKWIADNQDKSAETLARKQDRLDKMKVREEASPENLVQAIKNLRQRVRSLEQALETP